MAISPLGMAIAQRADFCWGPSIVLTERGRWEQVSRDAPAEGWGRSVCWRVAAKVDPYAEVGKKESGLLWGISACQGLAKHRFRLLERLPFRQNDAQVQVGARIVVFLSHTPEQGLADPQQFPEVHAQAVRRLCQGL